MAALQRARVEAYAHGEFVEQESFMTAGEIQALARVAGIDRGVTVLDVCCGVAGPGRFITRELGCDYLGVDLDASAIEVARERAAGLPCRFEVARVPPLPGGTTGVGKVSCRASLPSRFIVQIAQLPSPEWPLYAIMSAVDAYAAFDRREAGWTKVELTPASG